MMLSVNLICFLGLVVAFTQVYTLDEGLSVFHPHKFKPETRIINGKDAAPHAYPYQVLIKSRHILFPIVCGGSLIKNDTVLTAAHCVQGALWLEITLGAHNISNPEETSQVHLTTRTWRYHQNWSRISLQNDIAIVKLPYEVPENDYIKTIKLSTDRFNNYANYTAYVTGWGRTFDRSPLSPTLKVLETRVMSNDECKSIMPFDTVIIDSHICTDGTGDEGFCAGDSGGPLVTNGVQIGIVSFNYPSCEKSKPSVYTRVTSFINWLKQYGGL